MRKLIQFIFLLISFSNLNAQADEQILNELLFHLFDHQELVKGIIHIEEKQIKTYFSKDSISLELETGFAIPSNIISEWEKNIENQTFQPKWNEESFNKRDTVLIGKDTVLSKKPIFKCLSEHEMHQMLRSSQKLFNLDRQQFYEKQEVIYSIGRIIFDSSRETAIFSFVGSSRSDAAWGRTVLIKKVFEKWIIIASFDYWMT